MAHHRLFVALRPPAAVRGALLRAMGGVPGARWQSDEQLHITLRFIGEVDRHRAEDIAASLGHIRHPGFPLTLTESGTFERNGRVDALWIGVQPRERIKALHDKIDRTLAQAGVAPDGRAFLPHITLARFARSAAPPPDAAAGIVAPSLDPFAVTSFELFESHLGSEGAVYDTIARYPLDPVET
ncbi:RNA 2',3'-cyclic phosphodiesterase [Sphingomonas oligoaromativorans]|uniref:RNA 2',3'-cyclic phosphodiesterase n=1 Tax=Sphingomonas oligoaromativorans TaxID=575322 RepID=UPI0014222B2F|nr:RNA 2',3'-cyclic phosphodiesterase [Sphingomonas oligoaromativorans]NIJ31868.1 2'-5' RNA ligase [Sphingomonas oligoaromativorans]